MPDREPIATGAQFIRHAGYDGCVELSNASTQVILEPNVGGRVISYALNGIEALYQDPEQDGVVWDGGSSLTQPSAGRWDVGPEYEGPQRKELWLGKWSAEVLDAPLPIGAAQTETALHAAQPGGNPKAKARQAPAEGTRTQGARMTSQVAASSGLRVIREFVLHTQTSRLRCTQIMQNRGTKPFVVFHWSRTFLPAGGIAMARLPRHGKFPRGYALGGPPGVVDFLPPEEPNIRARKGLLEILGPPSKAKFLLDVEPGWLAYAGANGLLFLKRFPVYAQRAYGEVAANNASVWCSSPQNAPTWQGAGYPVEVEAIGPREILEPGDECSFTEEWWLRKPHL